MVREAWGKVRNGNDYWYIIDDFAQDCSISNELAVEILQSCTKPSIITWKKSFTFRFHRNMYLTVQLTSDHQLFGKWLGAKQVSSHHLIHCLSRPMGLNELTICTWNHARKSFHKFPCHWSATYWNPPYTHLSHAANSMSTHDLAMSGAGHL